MLKKIIEKLEETMKNDICLKKDCAHIAANVRTQDIINCEQDILQAKFKHYGVGTPIK